MVTSSLNGANNRVSDGRNIFCVLINLKFPSKYLSAYYEKVARSFVGIKERNKEIEGSVAAK